MFIVDDSVIVWSTVSVSELASLFLMMSSGLFLLLSAKSSCEVSCRFDLVTLIGVDVDSCHLLLSGSIFSCFVFKMTLTA